MNVNICCAEKKELLIGNKEIKKCSCSGYNLDKLIQPMVLSLLKQQPMYGYSIFQAIGEKSAFFDEKPDGTGIYRTLNGMEKRGMVVSAWDTNDSGPAKRVYSITAEGEKCLKLWLPTLENYVQYIQGLVNDLNKILNDDEDENN